MTEKRIDGWLQTLLYCEAYLANKPESIVRPSVYAIKKLAVSSLSDKLRIKGASSGDLIIEDYKLIREDFISGLTGIVNTIFSEDEPFIMTKDARTKCTYCPYKTLCMR